MRLRGDARYLTCHPPGTFFRFARTTRTAKVLLLLPGPVKVEMRRSRRFTRDAAVPKIRVVVKAMDFRGKLVADAMFETRNGMRSLMRQLQQRSVFGLLN